MEAKHFFKKEKKRKPLQLDKVSSQLRHRELIGFITQEAQGRATRQPWKTQEATGGDSGQCASQRGLPEPNKVACSLSQLLPLPLRGHKTLNPGQLHSLKPWPGLGPDRPGKVDGRPEVRSVATFQALPSSLPTIAGSPDFPGLRPLHPMHQHRGFPVKPQISGPAKIHLMAPGCCLWHGFQPLAAPLLGQDRPAFMGRWARTSHNLETLPKA